MTCPLPLEINIYYLMNTHHWCSISTDLINNVLPNLREGPKVSQTKVVLCGFKSQAILWHCLLNLSESPMYFWAVANRRGDLSGYNGTLPLYCYFTQHNSLCRQQMHRLFGSHGVTKSLAQMEGWSGGTQTRSLQNFVWCVHNTFSWQC